MVSQPRFFSRCSAKVRWTSLSSLLVPVITDASEGGGHPGHQGDAAIEIEGLEVRRAEYRHEVGFQLRPQGTHALGCDIRRLVAGHCELLSDQAEQERVVQ